MTNTCSGQFFSVDDHASVAIHTLNGKKARKYNDTGHVSKDIILVLHN